MSLPLCSYNFGYAHTVYYRLYTKDGPIKSNNPIYANNPFISRTLPIFVTPPRTVLSVKKYLCKIEGLSGPKGSTLFESLSSQTAVEESFRLAVKESSGPGVSEDDPLVLVVGVEDAEKRSASTAQSEGLLEAVQAEARYGLSQDLVISILGLLVSSSLLSPLWRRWRTSFEDVFRLERLFLGPHRYALHPTATNGLFVKFPSHEGRGLGDSNRSIVRRHGQRGVDDW